jgi:signal transduction histidine kinase
VVAEQREGRVVVAVSDTGVGIPETDLEHVFDDFYRADTGEIREGGAGLGLAISKRIVEAHDGTISVESEVGKGTTFTISLPAWSTEAADGIPGVWAMSDAPGGRGNP